MISAWYRHLKTEEEQQQFKNEVLGSKRILKRVQELMEQEKPQASSYDTPNWELRQADMIGYNRCLTLLSKLTNLDQEVK